MAEVAASSQSFHESVVHMIDKASIYDLYCLGELIKTTVIPKGHDKIIEAWCRRVDAEQMMGWETSRSSGVVDYLRADKERAEAEGTEGFEEFIDTTFEELNVGDEFCYGESRFRKTGPDQVVEYLSRTGAEYDPGKIDGARPWPVKKVVRKGN